MINEILWAKRPKHNHGQSIDGFVEEQSFSTASLGLEAQDVDSLLSEDFSEVEEEIDESAAGEDLDESAADTKTDAFTKTRHDRYRTNPFIVDSIVNLAYIGVQTE